LDFALRDGAQNFGAPSFGLALHFFCLTCCRLGLEPVLLTQTQHGIAKASQDQQYERDRQNEQEAPTDLRSIHHDDNGKRYASENRTGVKRNTSSLGQGARPSGDVPNESEYWARYGTVAIADAHGSPLCDSLRSDVRWRCGCGCGLGVRLAAFSFFDTRFPAMPDYVPIVLGPQPGVSAAFKPAA
jgi:hypothetical protein